ncbi:MAG TPA: glycosyltransferase family 4 protein [Vicinamibacterales bacterium]|nr:glycosyltransferase family 4 protein [Vicinamibacterales bacterium]
MKRSAVRRRLLTIAHSYCVELNRRLPQELARAGGWDVVAVAPARFRGDFGWHVTESKADEPCRVVPVPVHFSRPVHTMMYGSALTKLLSEPWDLVHCWEEPYVAAAAQIARATAPRVPLVYATFQNIMKRYPPPFAWIEKYALGRADGMIAYGDTSRAVLDDRGWSGRTRTIPPGVDVAHFKPDAAARDRVRRELGWKDDVPVVGFVGRFVPEKGIARLTAALDRVASPWRVLFLGSGPLDADLRAWSRRHGDRVRIQPAVAHDDVPAYLNAMDVLCAPSQTTEKWREQFGRMLIEAFACGVPVIASDSGEIPHVVGDAGVVVPEADDAAWVRAIDGLLADPERRAELSRRGRGRAVTVYAWPIVARRHLEFFGELIR